MKFETEKFNYKILPINEISKRSKQFYKLIKKRRSIRSFNTRNINLDIIENAILASGTAPSGANLQPWHFVVITNKIIKKKNSYSC